MLYFKNCEIKVGTGVQYNEIMFLSSTKEKVASVYIYQTAQATASTVTMDSNNNLLSYNTSEVSSEFEFVRISGNHIGADSVITVNQPIE